MDWGLAKLYYKYLDVALLQSAFQSCFQGLQLKYQIKETLSLCTKQYLPYLNKGVVLKLCKWKCNIDWLSSMVWYFGKTQYDPGKTHVRPSIFILAALSDVITYRCQIAIIVKSKLLAFYRTSCHTGRLTVLAHKIHFIRLQFS